MAPSMGAFNQHHQLIGEKHLVTAQEILTIIWEKLWKMGDSPFLFTYCEWLRNPPPPHEWLKAYKSWETVYQLVQDFFHPQYPLVDIQKAIENGHLSVIYPWKVVIFHSDVNVYQRVFQLSTIVFNPYAIESPALTSGSTNRREDKLQELGTTAIWYSVRGQPRIIRI